jgi:hypothetical protein
MKVLEPDKYHTYRKLREKGTKQTTAEINKIEMESKRDRLG